MHSLVIVVYAVAGFPSIGLIARGIPEVIVVGAPRDELAEGLLNVF